LVNLNFENEYQQPSQVPRGLPVWFENDPKLPTAFLPLATCKVAQGYSHARDTVFAEHERHQVAQRQRRGRCRHRSKHSISDGRLVKAIIAAEPRCVEGAYEYDAADQKTEESRQKGR
jgi:hypothetical protein